MQGVVRDRDQLTIQPNPDSLVQEFNDKLRTLRTLQDPNGEIDCPSRVNLTVLLSRLNQQEQDPAYGRVPGGLKTNEIPTNCAQKTSRRGATEGPDPFERSDWHAPAEDGAKLSFHFFSGAWDLSSIVATCTVLKALTTDLWRDQVTLPDTIPQDQGARGPPPDLKETSRRHGPAHSFHQKLVVSGRKSKTPPDFGSWRDLTIHTSEQLSDGLPFHLLLS
ncbi:hypothetical protein FOL47_010808 [Perkinsus chesapeaki]|uniref:Uncharacterized protein n=1 Tax=Perkinsus chesapeaki TaxID=330153 RepID=A0A7J6KZW2_PERCH|nr:hypothetical protein FOL47_010808 [Perkinsus chesapeaki]